MKIGTREHNARNGLPGRRNRGTTMLFHPRIFLCNRDKRRYLPSRDDNPKNRRFSCLGRGSDQLNARGCVTSGAERRPSNSRACYEEHIVVDTQSRAVFPLSLSLCCLFARVVDLLSSSRAFHPPRDHPPPRRNPCTRAFSFFRPFFPLCLRLSLRLCPAARVALGNSKAI